MARQARALATRQAVLLAAAEVFDERGYAAATMSEILERAGVTKGALYFHFGSKEELALAVIEGQGAWLATWRPTSDSPVQTLIDLGYAFAHALVDDPMVRGSIRLTIEHGSFTQPQIAAYQRWSDAARALLEQARDAGDLHPGLDPAAAAGVITGAVTGIQLSSQVLTGRRDLLQRMADLWTMLLPGLVQPHALARISVAERAPGGGPGQAPTPAAGTGD
ncbi:ScbR family autoregulator-binding transcription factor [Kitasatospora sp. CM 4170]|uniref:ScbR family autoregulator-binding transcription factor n=1 Tax=Kitasatospora aburaviensis TaxID=67265 RepID=A0ABW1EWU3_9ACTN|nr:ScbR family autoregulator-binding transcription factor [Kitasatospora sp. CM 4170]WNM46377.1 ScbR family autoregulator-binding transcription factor [Kitasatospora sp. CM 4170]